MKTFHRRAMLVASLTLAAVCLGCGDAGPKLTEVKGKITYKGKAVPGGMVVFQTADGSRGVAPIAADGSYTMQSPLGPVKAAVVTRPATSDSVNNPNRPAVRDVRMPPGVNPKSLPPEKYESFETSGLSYEVKEGSQTIDIPLD